MRRIFVFITVITLFVAAPAMADIPYAARTTLHSGYDSEHALTEEQITGLLNAAFSMPTGGNQRALEFFVVTDREILFGMKGGNPYSQAVFCKPFLEEIAKHFWRLLQLHFGGSCSRSITDEVSERGACGRRPARSLC